MKKRTKLIMIIIGVLTCGLLLLATLSFTYGLYLYTGILKFYRIMVGVLIGYISFLFISWLIIMMARKKLKGFIVLIVFSLLYVGSIAGAAYVLNGIVKKLEGFNKDTVSYSTTLISFSENYKDINALMNTKIGVVEDTTDMEGYILPYEVIKEYKLEDNNKIMLYNSATDLLAALYDGDLDLIFINSNYVDVYSLLEEFKDIEDKAIEVKTLTKEYDKEQIQDSSTETSKKSLTEPFTVLLLGVDSTKDGLNKSAAFNGDTQMLITVNPDTMQATMFSVPRDTYVPVTCSSNKMKKINSAAYGGTKCVINTLEKFTGIEIDYYVKINFRGVVDLVNALGGIEVDVPTTFCGSNSKRQTSASKQICLKEGVSTLNGEQALCLARERYAFAAGDFTRGQNQQLIVEAMLQATKRIKSVSQVVEIFDTISRNIDTNITKDQILSFYDFAKKLMFSDKINTLNIQKTYLRGYDHYVYEPASKGLRYAFFHFKGSLSDITDAMKVNLGLKKVTMIKKFSFSINTEYEREIIGDHYYSESRVALTPNFTSDKVKEAYNWATTNGINFKAVDASGNTISSSDYSKYIITYQSIVYKTPLFRLTSSSTLKVKAKLKTSGTVVKPTEPTEEETSSTETSSSESATE